jgi:hypothetical protein
MPTNPIDYALDANAAAPAVDGFAITPNDVTNFTVTARGIWCGTAGNVVLITPRGSVLTFAVQAGSFLPFWAVRVNSTSTTATGLVGAI